MDFIERLKQVKTGTSLEVHTKGGQFFDGIVSEMADTYMAVKKGNKNIVIPFEFIEFYIEDISSSNIVSPEQGQIEKVKTETKPQSNATYSVNPYKPSFFVRVEKNGVSDKCLQDAFSELDTASKKKINSRYNGYMYALKVVDHNRAKQICNALSDDIAADKDLSNDYKAWKVAAYMALKCGCFTDDDIMLKGRCFCRAAINAYLAKKYADACVFACLAVLYDDMEEAENMIYTIIFDCCVKCDDVSAAVKMLKATDISTLNMDLMNALFSAKGSVSNGLSMTQKLKNLEALYDNAKTVDALQNIITVYKLDIGKIQHIATTGWTTDGTSPISCSGKIIKISWVMEGGTIEYGDDDEKQSCLFIFDDIEDEKLKKEVKASTSRNVDEKSMYVSFDLADGKAVHIKRAYRVQKEKEHVSGTFAPDPFDLLQTILPEEALKMGRHVVASSAGVCRFADAADVFEIALDCEKDRTDALSELINACVAYRNAMGAEDPAGETYLAKALKKYREYDDRIVHDFKYDVAAFGIMTKYGTTDEKIKAIERLLKYDTIKPQQRLIYICSLADIYLKQAEQTNDRASYEKAKKGYQEWESVFYADAKIFSAAANNNTYYNRILVSLASCLIKLDETEQAEQILTKILKYDSSIEAANKMYNELFGDSGDFIEDDDEQETAENEDIFIDEEPSDKVDSDEEFIENLQPYSDVADWEELHLTEKQAMDYVLSMRSENKNMYTVSMLKVLSDANDKFSPLYKAVSLAIDNPMENLGYSASDVLSAFSENSDYGEMTIAYSFAAASLRSAFYQTEGSDYMLNALCDSIQLCSKYPRLREIYTILANYKNQYGKGVDTFASYRFTDISTQESKLSEIVRKIDEIYKQEFLNKRIKEYINQIRFKITKSYVYEKGGVLETTLKSIRDNDTDGFEEIKKSFADYFIRNGAKIQRSNVQNSKIEDFIDECWERAGKHERVAERKTSDLMGSLRNNLRSHITNIVHVICDWYELYENGLVATIDSTEKRAFAQLEGNLISVLNDLHDELTSELAGSVDDDVRMGIGLLAATVDELSGKLIGSWNQNERTYYFADFLQSNCILLDEDYLPDFTSTFYSLSDFNVFARLQKHIEDGEKSIESNTKKIYSRERYFNNFGAAELIAAYTQASSSLNSWYLPDNADEYCTQAEEKIKACYRQFIEDIQFANGKGQIMLYDKFMSCIEDTAAYWYTYCLKTKNYGFFFEFVDACMKKVHSEASAYKDKLLNELASMYNTSPELFADDDTKAKVEEQIESLNFLVAEDWMNRLRRGDYYTPSSNTVDAVKNLQDFWNEFDRNYDSAKDTSVSLKLQVTRGGHIPAKDRRGGMSLINNWLSNGRKSFCEKIEGILNALGWENIDVKDISNDSFECYRVKSTEKYTKRKYPHPIADFGTASKNTGFNVVCLYGFYSADRLINAYRKLEDIAGNKIILLDYALNAAERRRLARKVKEVTLSNTYMLIDRVSVIYVANHYVSGMVNGMLMSISMPFSYCQPYNEISTIEMAPEMFIGREDELLSIESPTGANLVFGGRQLGKSSLLKKAKNDIDGDELGRKAVFLDLKETDYKAAALKISRELVDRGILSADKETSDWDDLERAIINRLRDEDDEIPYLLLMLDEADYLIESSKDANFIPIVKLKNIQQSSSGKFKFVLAGLHDIVRFNRSIALGYNSVITHLSSINVKPFKHEDAKNLLIDPLSYLGFSFNDDSVLISQILAATNYFPGLIQLYCKKLIEAMRSNYADYNENQTPPYMVTETHIKKVLSDKGFRDEIKKKFEITLMLDDTYYLIALIMAMLDDESSDQIGYSPNDILQEAKILSIESIASLKTEDIDAFLGELTDLNILKSTGNGTYGFSTKNFRDMLGSKNEVEEKILSLME